VVASSEGKSACRIASRAALATLALSVAARPGRATENGRRARASPLPVEDVSVKSATAAEILRAVRASDAPVVLVNVWATWCLPCRQEFPDIVRLRKSWAGRGLRVIFVSGDFESELPAVKRFLAEQGVDFPTYLKRGKDMEFIDAFDPKWSGALPATFLYDRSGTRRRSLFGKSSYDRLEGAVRKLLAADGSSKVEGEGR
jgi:thiol-disulfide isomerase/thioredoxin